MTFLSFIEIAEIGIILIILLPLEIFASWIWKKLYNYMEI